MKKLAVILLAAVMFVLASMAASAVTCTTSWNLPTGTGATINGNYMFNVSVQCDSPQAGGDGNATNVTFEYKLTTASTWTTINTTAPTGVQDATGQCINQTGPDADYTFYRRLDTTALYDQLTYQVRITAYNGSNNEGTAVGQQVAQDTTLAAIYINNTVPLATFDTLKTSDEVKFPATIVASTGRASSCVFRLYDTDTDYKEYTGTMNKETLNSEDCSYTFESHMFPEGIKKYVKVIASDLGVVDTATVTAENVQFTKSISGARRAQIDQDYVVSTAQPTQQTDLVKIAAVAVLIFAVYHFVLKKRK